MKFSTIALIATVAAYDADEDETLALNIFGYNEGNIFDFE